MRFASNERIRRETVSLHPLQLSGCAEESRIAMHKVATFAALVQAKNLYCGGHFSAQGDG